MVYVQEMAAATSRPESVAVSKRPSFRRLPLCFKPWILPFVVAGLLVLIPQTVVGEAARQGAAPPQNANLGEICPDPEAATQDLLVTLAGGESNPAGGIDLSAQSDCQISIVLGTTAVVYKSMPISFTIRITNTGDTWIRTLPMRDVYDTTYLTYGYTDAYGIATYAGIASDDHINDGVIDWSDLTVSLGQDLAPGASFTLVITFTAREDTTLLPPDGKTENRVLIHDAWADPDGDGPLGPELPVPLRQDSERVTIEAYLGVIVGEVQAVARPDGVLVHWETAVELDVVGFNLLRRVDGSPWVAVNEQFVFAEYAGSQQGAPYAYLDKEVTPGTTYEYMLEMVKRDGRVEWYGPVSTTMNWWIRLPLVM